MLHAFHSLRAEIIQSAEHDGFGWTNLCTSRNKSAFLSIVTKCALESAAGIGQRFRPAIDYAEGAGDNAIAAAVANIILHEHRTDFGAYNCAGRTRFEATGFLAMLANV